ncbi:monovalent cation:proton antiporter-2 (CPA2) family protein [Bauldia litoralis]|uniref:Glutathione-regulated potassium-efflux system protein KefB n=1 Tax=Bauldia litoralis TaxID=665467 RepID=A0A1G6C6C2_9HYPH|nr:monovalent cation:proton antiporter-2 (CPA2) family protein [Bauldia litoralis]SDB28436.1 glutathione-regulated potassium-efflux system protein KefB [Bauldia litoralis]
MSVESHGVDLLPAVALLAAGVVAVPIFKRIGLGSVIGYLVAGIAIGPFGLRLFTDPESIISVAELGVVMLLFIIGLELKPSRLWSLKQDIFGLGLTQVLVCTAVLAGVAMVVGLSGPVAIVAAMGLALSSTAIVMQILEERGETTDTHGQKIFSILLLQDLAIVPALAVVAFLAPTGDEHTAASRWLEAGIAVGAVLGVIVFGRYLLNPIFRFLANTRAREVMTAAALLVVLGSAFVMQVGGLSMAMGAFLAGVLLSESSFRHELEADIEPFRGLLLGLFFLGVGMSLDIAFIGQSWATIIAVVVGFMALKAAGIYAAARLFRNAHDDALRIALMLAQGGEFGFVLYATAISSNLFTPDTAALLNAAVILSMALTPLAPIVLRRLLPIRQSFEGVEAADGLEGTALVIGFGRFGQVASQALLARGTDVSIIDSNTEMIRSAARFGFKIYYGDGSRLDVLRVAGAGRAKIIAICIDDRKAADKAVEIIKSEFPLAKLLVRSYDRGHSLSLISAGVDYEIRETLESAMRFGEAALIALGVPQEEAAEIAGDVRKRDAERFKAQMAEGIYGGRDLIRTGPTPTPLSQPKRHAQPLSPETAAVADDGKAGAEN